ncbi:MAG TPA: GNAT family N-acetyltransferase [Crinalium sp.]|jgi:predicted acetyltransferase
MTHDFEYHSLTEDNAKPLGLILSQCFNSLPDPNDSYLQRIGLDNFRTIHRSGALVGGLATIPMGQWWGKQLVPMTGLAAVGIAPEHRGSGAAIALLQHTLQELHDKGVALSALYPATQRLYRKAGYEQGGTLCTWSIQTGSIHMQERGLPWQPVEPGNYDVLHTLYCQQAKQQNGLLDRHPAIWKGIVKPGDREGLYAYLLGTRDAPQGYVIFSQQPTENGGTLRLRDWAILSSAAVRSFWTFIADHRSTIKHARWRSAAIDPLTLVLPEQSAQSHSTERWMLRIVHVKHALEKRGYPPGLQAELHLDIHDDLLPENSGKFILSVANGQGQVTRAGNGDLKIGIRGLAPLYSGLFTPAQLQLAGYLDAPDSTLAIATQLFAGPPPWMLDFF